jgi:hypothetical protein
MRLREAGSEGSWHADVRDRAYLGPDPGNRNRIESLAHRRVGTTQQSPQVQGAG